jgi:hypothetical protein
MEIEQETETTITLDGNYSVDVFLDGEHEWDIATTEAETKIRIREQE